MLLPSEGRASEDQGQREKKVGITASPDEEHESSGKWLVADF